MTLRLVPMVDGQEDNVLYCLVVMAAPIPGEVIRQAFYWATRENVEALYDALSAPGGHYAFPGDNIRVLKIAGELIYDDPVPLVS